MRIRKALVSNAGDPSILDSDETPSDMGVYPADPHDWENKTLLYNSFDPYDWVCFPVIDTRLNGANVATDYFEELFDAYNSYCSAIEWADGEGMYYYSPGQE